MKSTIMAVAAALFIVSAPITSAQERIECYNDPRGCQSRLVNSAEAAQAIRTQIVRNLVTVNRTPAEAQRYYFDLTFADECGDGSRLKQLAIGFIEGQTANGWDRFLQRLRGVAVSDTKTFTLNVAVQRVTATGNVDLGETPVIAYTRNRKGDIENIDCDARLATKLVANTDLKLTFKFYVSRQPQTNPTTVANLRIAARVGTFLIGSGLFPAGLAALPGNVLAETGADQIKNADTYFKENFEEIQQQRVSAAMRPTVSMLTMQRKPFVKKEYFYSAWADTDEQGHLLRPLEDIGQSIKAQTNIDVMPLVAREVRDYVANLTESAAAARRTCTSLKSVFGTLGSKVDQLIALYYVLKSNRDVLEGNAKYHCFASDEVGLLREAGLVHPPYAEAYSRAPVRVAGGAPAQ